MSRTLFIIALVLPLSAPAVAGGSTYVDGYTRRDGTYVEGHYRTNPDSSRLNNWSTEGNYNPYTGKEGTVDPYAPSYNSNSYGLYGSGSGSRRRW